ncbi:hypothetical protein KDW99_16285 [Marinomonas rhizomae]|uniref:hypothetical protein n=1 Tax=Marinomonas rhizomae TaxID=491948 RepID=UPI0021048771|nr:hypothetical protein [Marinomonas rhizomae]UTV98796.1 hypothetical protein KDW99_16285 [Marinomonas rhizomae]
MDLLIPFGLSNTTNEVIEPHEADRGRACDAYCPGCKTPLLSRHPQDTETRIHFAHDSRHPKASKKTIQDCPFNGPLAIALMARALAPQLSGESLSNPELNIRVSCKLCNSEIFTDSVSIKNSITIKKAESSYTKFGALFDLRIELGNASILIWLAYADRPLPEIEYKNLERIGVLKIDVNSFDSFQFKRGTKSFQDSVKDFLLLDGKREWIYHPAEKKRATEKAKENNHSCVVFECSKCNSKWFHDVKKMPECPKKCAIRYTKKSMNQTKIAYEDTFFISRY